MAVIDIFKRVEKVCGSGEIYRTKPYDTIVWQQKVAWQTRWNSAGVNGINQRETTDERK